MLKVRTYNPEHSEKGTIYCQSTEFHGRTGIACCDVDHIEGAVDVIDYYHGQNHTDVIIPFRVWAETHAA